MDIPKQSSAANSTSSSKSVATKKWLTRRFRAAKVAGGMTGPSIPLSSERPQTAPSPGTTRVPATPPPTVEIPLTRPLNKPPPRPPRPDSATINNVNQWLDRNLVKQAPPLMTGLSYWREGACAEAGGPGGIQYAMPIDREEQKPAAPHGQHIKAFCRRAKKMQVRMPSLLRAKPQCNSVHQQQMHRRSASTHLLALPYENTEDTNSTARLLAYPQSPGSLLQRPSTASASMRTPDSRGAISQTIFTPSNRHNSAVSAGTGGSAQSMERRIDLVTLFSPMASAYLSREDSLGNMSEAPTYFTGRRPPSYRSRPASIITTSSFGCIDGMNPEQRQLSQQRAQRNRGVKGKFKKLAQRAHLSK
ncbi:hypothetical protein BS50DRAFT_582170 [Corynespora cassiicola Philippines]|uniref:Uncharacterized protein n=1 Tax=Corynespora cassiicola Philippines TaxID=1448308 RepID=A0A2T2PCT5_CORCC|nr:hypothetical protein BS50DRAFT_582170 [Corynespora cassiicola Philippines]